MGALAFMVCVAYCLGFLVHYHPDYLLGFFYTYRLGLYSGVLSVHNVFALEASP